MSYNLCCPQCGNEDLQVINESNTQTTGGGYSAGKGCLGYLIFGPLGLLCGGCGSGVKSTTTNTTYWVCPKCGKKFKSPQELRKELDNQRNGIPAMIVCGILISILAFFMFFGVAFKGEHLEGGQTFFCIIIGLLPFAISAIAAAATKSSLETKENEILELERQMEKFNSGNRGMNYTNSSFTSNAQSSTSSLKWTCSCGSVNTASNNYCKTCGKKRDVPLQSYVQPSNTVHRNTNEKWKCLCGTENLSTTNYCSNCGKQRVILGANEWLCPKCGRINQNYVGTCGCGERKPMPNISSGNNEKYINCPDCGTKQTSEHTNCYRCGCKLNK